MRAALKRCALFLGLIVLVVLVMVVILLYPRYANMKSEYITAGVIKDVEKYVQTHGGEWPKSWQDVGEDYSDYTIVRFDLSSEGIMRDHNLIYEAVRPVSGKYYTYPHSREDLERLRDAIIKSKKDKAGP